MNAKEFAKYLRRDGGCVHCGSPDAVPHHRGNRGFGGFKKADRPSNIIAMCAEANGLMESDAAFAILARRFGWKVSKFANPETEPVWYPAEGRWFYLDDFYERAVLQRN